jgi:opacity protein-like surface antigen
MNYRQFLLVILVLLLGISPMQAQDNIMSMSYNIAIPNAEFNDFQAGRASTRGFNLEYSKYVNWETSIGFNVGWQIFNHTVEKDVYTFDNFAVNAKTWRYTHVVPIMVNAHYNFLRDNAVELFLGGGTGVYYVNNEVWVGLAEIRFDTWRWGLYPEAGANIQFSDDIGLRLSTKYQFVLNGFLDGEESLSYWDFRMGFYFKY